MSSSALFMHFLHLCLNITLYFPLKVRIQTNSWIEFKIDLPSSPGSFISIVEIIAPILIIDYAKVYSYFDPRG